MYANNWGGGGWEGFGPGMMGGAPWIFGAMALAAPFIMLIVLWSVGWKALALWHSARRGQPWWFVILLVVNTMGILEIIYLFGIAKLKFSELFSKHVHNNHH